MGTPLKDKKNQFGITDGEILRITQAIKINKKVKKIILFGSRAKGNFQRGSDIDLAIVGNKITFEEFLQIKVDVEELMLPYHVDIVEFNKIKNQELKEHIQRVGKYLN